MNKEFYQKLQRHLASFLHYNAKFDDVESIAIMLMLKTEEQVLTMMDYIDKHRDGDLSFKHLWDVAIAISKQVKS